MAGERSEKAGVDLKGYGPLRTVIGLIILDPQLGGVLPFRVAINQGAL